MTALGKTPKLGSLRAEWVKFWSLTSNRILIAVAVLFVPLNALLFSTSLRQRAEDPDVSMRIPTVEPVAYLDSVLWVQLLVAVIAVLAATQENGGRLSISFLAIPTRTPVLLAKATVIGALAFMVGMFGAFIGQVLPLALLNGSGVNYPFDTRTAFGFAAASGLYLAGIAVISLAMATLLRNLVVALLVPLATFTVVPSVIGWLGGKTGETVSGYFPTLAGRTAITAMENPAGLDSAGGFGIMAAWAVLLMAVAAVAYRFRDAG